MGLRGRHARREGSGLSADGDLLAVLSGSVLDAAPRLLGARVASEVGGRRVVAHLVEVEAYAGPGDPGSHAFRGPTPRTRVMFGPPGRLYVYFSYGMHWCANVVCGAEGTASAVLLRGARVVEGVEVARERRAGAPDRDLARGPARLCRALGVDGGCDGADVLDPASPVRLALGDPAPSDLVRTGPRTGVAGSGGDPALHPWRFWLDGDPAVSPYRRAVPRRRAR